MVRLGLRGVNAERGTLELHKDAGPQQEASFQTYRVRLVQLAPYPKDSTGISAEKYVATLIVVKRTP